MKSLNFEGFEELDKKVLNGNVHYDKADSILALEHMGEYIVVQNSDQSHRKSPRLYLSHVYENEYFNERTKQDKKDIGARPKLSKMHIYDHFPKHKIFIDDAIKKLFTNVRTASNSKAVLLGMSILLKALDIEDIHLEKFEQLTTFHQDIVWQNIDKITAYEYDQTCVSIFFGIVANFLDTVETKEYTFTIKNNTPLEAYPLITTMKLDIKAREELNTIKKRANEYKEWKQELECFNLFSLENLAYTLYYNIDKDGSRAANNVVLRKLALMLYDIDLLSWKERSKKRGIYYKNNKQKKEHERIIALSKSGKNINVTDEKMFAFWHMTLHPKYPFDKEVTDKYKDIYTNKNSFRTNVSKRINLSLVDFDARFCCTVNHMYPLALLLLIREGMNGEVLRDWRVWKDSSGNYKIGNENSLSVAITGEKRRTNTNIVTYVYAKSQQKKLLDFILDFNKDVYDLSSSNKLFQFITIKDKSVCEWGGGTYFFSSANRSKTSFLNKYNFKDINGERMTNIDHRRLRVSASYADYLRGLTSFEKQLKKGHKDINTQVTHYNNSAEWEGLKKHKIAYAQNSIVDLIRGVKDDDRLNKLFDGPIANCSDPSNPTYDNAPNLKKDDKCLDWFKCLSQCDKSIVIPRIHGGVIFAWIAYMENEREERIRESDWERDYLLDYQSALAVVDGFTEQEKKHADKEKYKHEGVIKMMIGQKTKVIKERTHA